MSRTWHWLGLFGLVAAVHFASRVDTSFDSRWTLPTAMSLLTEGDLDLDEYPAAHDPTEYRIRRIGGHLYHNFPPGPALLAVPVVAVAHQLLPPVLGLDLQRLLQQRVVAKL
ncbi:MAG: hypothetical protein HUU35_11570, partial [Armatimonadetes bacterium]|nr:hypothetical protein [Armatimonadota bacterium]